MQDNDEFDESELQALLDSAKLLPRDIAPAPEAWITIRDRIERSRVRQLVPFSGTTESDNTIVSAASADSPRRAPAERTRLALSIAAALFLTVSAYAVIHERSDNTPAGSITVASNGLSPVQATAASASIESVFAQYDTATADLTKDLEQRRSRLQPAAVAVLDSCLTTIDRAIRESRSALANAPDNTTIAELLQLTYQQKLDLLRRSADLPLGSL